MPWTEGAKEASSEITKQPDFALDFLGALLVADFASPFWVPFWVPILGSTSASIFGGRKSAPNFQK